MTVNQNPDGRQREAASWFSRLSQTRVSVEDVEQFAIWRRDSANARAYDRVEAVWRAAERLKHDPAVRTMTEEAMRASPASARAHVRMARLLKPLGAAVVGALALGVALVWWTARPAHYSTEVAEQRLVRLEDGSRITLDTATKVRVRYSGDTREVVLEDGQAFFDVEASPRRPFIVRAGDVRITALGTAFDVRRLETGTRVILIEGRVEVEDRTGPERPTVLRPGQALDTQASAAGPRFVDVQAETSWRQGRLIFQATPLPSAVREINRYSTVSIALAPSVGRDRSISGAFDTGDTEAFVSAVSDLYGLKAHRDGDRILLSPAG